MHLEIAGYDFRTAVVLGDAARVRELLAQDPGLAVRPTEPAGWPPLLGVCSSRWHRIDPSRVEGLLEVARMLLDAGADPNTRTLPGRRARCSTLFAAPGTANNPQITRLLLERGAVPDDETLYLSAFFPDHQCLRILLAHEAPLDKAFALSAPISTGDIEGVRLMLELGFPVNTRAGEHGCTALHTAAVSGSAELVRLLIDAGADLEARDATWNDTPLGWAIVGSGFGRSDPNSRHSPNADFGATVRTLVEAGASLEDIRPGPDKPPSQEVVEVLHSYVISSSIA